MEKLGTLLLTGLATATFFMANRLPVNAQTVVVEEGFNDNTTLGWSFDGVNFAPCLTAGDEFTPAGSILPCNPNAPDQLGEGVLRLTSNGPAQSAFAFYDYDLPSGQGLVITFDYFTYGGVEAGNPLSPGDGITFFLFDGEATNPTPGAFGGSLGYAQRTDNNNPINGLTQGYVGVGLDEYGGFANDGEGRGTGCTVQSPFGANNRVLDSVTVRGSGNGLQGYCFIDNSGNLLTQFGTGIDEPTATEGNRNPARRKLRITLTADNTISVEIDFTGTGTNFQQVIAPTPLTTAPDQADLPSVLKLGIASSTAGATNFHEIGNLRAVTIGDIPTPDLALRKKQIPASLTPGGTGQYRLRVTNVGDGATFSPTIVTDTLPPGFSLTSFTGNGWSCSENPPETVTCVYSPVIQPSESQAVVLTVNVPSTPGSYINTATVSTTSDENPNNNAAQASNLLPPPPPICNRAGDICQF